MRLWHQKLIKYLPRQQLLGQHRECCALRGNGWGKPHATVNYVFNYAPIFLFKYHKLVMQEMQRRGYNVDELWLNPIYRGKSCEAFSLESLYKGDKEGEDSDDDLIYPDHNDAYLYECIDNLAEKGIQVNLEHAHALKENN